jgi:hypothetical protein
MIEVQQECGKPLLMVPIPGHDLNVGQQFCQAGIPFFESAERAMGTYALVFRYQRWRHVPEPDKIESKPIWREGRL